MMLLIYSENITRRFGYTMNLIFNEILGMEYEVTNDKEFFVNYAKEKLSYNDVCLKDEFHISKANNLLFEQTIYSFDVDYFFDDNKHKIFRTYNSEQINYDVFAAVFYMVSRYEEYLPFLSDKHNRFSYKSSLAYKYDFLEYPVVNIWVEDLKKSLNKFYNGNLIFKEKKPSFINTIDIDKAYCYKYSGIYRNIGGFFRDLFKKDWNKCSARLKTLSNIEKDPWDCYDYIINKILELKKEIKDVKTDTKYFVAIAERTDYDKNLSPLNLSFQSLLKKLADYATMGLHPGYYSLERPQEIAKSKKRLSSIIHKTVNATRFHFLRFRLPQSYRFLIDIGITDDYSMGYSDCVGFRAGVCCPYNFYDLDKDCESRLRIHPFEIMDVSLKNGLNMTIEDAFCKIVEIMKRVFEVQGEFITVWHNESLSDSDQWKGWQELYSKQIEEIKNQISFDESKAVE